MLLTDAQIAIMATEPGTMIYGHYSVPDVGLHTGLFIREDNEHIRQVRSNPIIAIKARWYRQGDVLLIVIMVKVGGELYESWLNAHQSKAGPKYVEDLAAQDKLAVQLYSDSRCERSIEGRNSIRKVMKGAREQLRHFLPWSVEDFEEARRAKYEEFPTPTDLWNALTSG